MKTLTTTKWIPLLLMTSMLPGLTACTDREVAIGFGAAAIGAGAIAIGAAAGSSHSGGGHYVCQGGYRPRCHSYRDYWGRLHQDCHSVYDSCASQRWVPHTASSSQLREVQLDELDWAETFSMSRGGAEKLLKALEDARSAEKLDSVLALGLSREDISAIGRFSMPSDDGIQSLARSLDQEAGATRDMIQRLVTLAGERIRHDSAN
jgi:hypothetical protein